MSKQLNGLDFSLLIGDKIQNVFLIRNPFDMILSWDAKGSVHQEPCSLSTMGLPKALQAFSELRQATGRVPIVVDSDLLKEYPREILTELCYRLKIPFDGRQLSWPAGPKSCDGMWAPFWYDQVHESTGFGSFQSNSDKYDSKNTMKDLKTLTAEQLSLYRDALPFYDALHRHAIGVDKLNPGTSKASLYISSSKIETRLADSRNVDVLIWVGDRLLPRELAKVSVFDSSVQGGDAVWEGLRVYNNHVFMFDEHVSRLHDSAKAL